MKVGTAPPQPLRQGCCGVGDSGLSLPLQLRSNSRRSSGAAGSAAQPSSLGCPPHPAPHPARGWLHEQDRLVFSTETPSWARGWQGLEAAEPAQLHPHHRSPRGCDWVRVSCTVLVALSPWGTLTLVPQRFSVPQGLCQPGFWLAGCSGCRAVSQPAARWLWQALELHVQESHSSLASLIPSAARPELWVRICSKLSCSRTGSEEGEGKTQLPTTPNPPRGVGRPTLGRTAV